MFSERTLTSRPVPAERRFTLALAGSWHRILLVLIGALATVLNFFGLGREGYNNEYYAAAVRSMSESWHNFFFASFDPGGFVTIDKPPLGFWFQVASVKLFGYNGVALLIPEALAGVLSLLLLYHLVSRTFGRVAGLIAALALAITPISVVTSRNNTIDSILVLFVLLAAWAVLRGAESGRLRWLLLSAVFVGLGFNVKMLEAYLVVPALGLVYLLGARTNIPRRLGHLVIAMVVMLVVSLSWAAAVDLTPASQRPWVDSTTTNSELDLAIGYNGLQRLTGNHSVGTPAGGVPRISAGRTGVRAGTTAGGAGSVGPGAGPGGNGPGGTGGGPGGIGENGPTGPLRLLDTQLGGQIGWLLPIAIIGFILALWQTRPRFRSLDDRQRSLVLWGTWLLTTGVFFSIALFYHTYYLVMVAPALAALAGIGVTAMWQAYRARGSRKWWALPLGLATAALVEAHILSAYPAYARWLTPVVLGACAIVAVALVVLRLRPSLGLRIGAAATILAILGLMTPPAVFAAYTTAHTQTGNIVRAGPQASGITGDFGGPPGGHVFDGGLSTGKLEVFGGGSSTGSSRAPSTARSTAGTPHQQAGTPPSRAARGTGSAGGSPPGRGTPGNANGSFGPPVRAGGASGPPPGNGTFGGPPNGRSAGSINPPSAGGSTSRAEGSGGLPGDSAGKQFTSGGPGGPGGFGGGQVSARLISYLETHRGNARYLVVTPSSQAAAPIIIKTGLPVMSLGGFSGSDPILSTAKLAALARSGVVKYFMLDGMGGGGPGGNSGLTTWIQHHSRVITVAGTQVYEYAGRS